MQRNGDHFRGGDLTSPGAESLFDGFALRPRNGAELRVLVIARISTVHQDARSLEDQLALCRDYVGRRHSGPTRFDPIQGRGSGELLDRQDLAQAEAAVDSRRYDLVIVEDLGRICRRARAIEFAEACEDAGTRLVAINDSIDTARDDWRLGAFFASFKHESGNKDTSRRIRRSLRNRFGQGGVIQTFPYGYLKPPGATSDADIRKDPEAEPIYEEWFRKLEAGASYAEVADSLNARDVPTGRWAKSSRWNSHIVARITHNPILKGVRCRNELMSKRNNHTGRRRSVKAPPEERLFRDVPHLAFIEAGRYDRLIAVLDARNAYYARGRKAGKSDCRIGVPKKRTNWPGQHLTCGICGRAYYWGGHGQADHMMCSGARDYRCWSSATCDGREAARRLAGAVLATAEALPEFDADFRARVEAAAAAGRSSRADDLRRLDARIGRIGPELANVADAIGRVGLSETLRDRLQALEAEKINLAAERAALLARPDETPTLPGIEDLKGRARAAVGRLALDDPEFGRLMHRLVPRIVVFPHQAIDGGAVVLRAELEVDFAPLLGPARDDLGGLVARTATVDLFDPPQRIAFRGRVVALRGSGRTERDVARELGLTVTAAQAAMNFQRRMIAAGTADPYRRLDAPPADSRKLRRHRHPRYRFEPLGEMRA